jgi:hypothetical protein
MTAAQVTGPGVRYGAGSAASPRSSACKQKHDIGGERSLTRTADRKAISNRLRPRLILERGHDDALNAAIP